MGMIYWLNLSDIFTHYESIKKMFVLIRN